MAVELTVCGVHVVRGDEPSSWNTGHYHQEVVDPEPDDDPDYTVAIEFVQMWVAKEGARGGWDATFFAAAVHPGHVDRCAGFAFADIEILDLDAEADRYPEESDYTVCGIYLETGRTYCCVWTTPGPAVAYYRAWEEATQEKLTFLLACVHEGILPCFDLPFADPTCDSDEAMQIWMRELDI